MSAAMPDGSADGVARLANGWVRLAIDYLRALLAEIGGYRGVVLGAVIQESWAASWAIKAPSDPSTPEPLPCYLNIARLADETGLRQPDLNTAKRDLIAQGLLIACPDGAVLPNKDFVNGWPGAMFLRPAPRGGKADRRALIDYCRDQALFFEEMRASSLAESRRRRPRTSPRTQRRRSPGTRPRPPASERREPGVSEISDSDVSEIPDTQLSEIPDTQLSQISDTCEPVYRKEITKTRQDEDESGRAPSGSGSGSGSRSGAIPPCPALPDEDGPWMNFGGEHDPSPAEVFSTFKLAWRCFPGTNICYEYWERQCWFSTVCWQAALRFCAKRKPGLTSIHYIIGVCRNHPNGVPLPEEPTGPTLTPSNGAAPPRRYGPAPVPPLPEIELTEAQRRRYAPIQPPPLEPRSPGADSP